MFCIRCGIEITNGDLICQDCRNAAENGALNAPVNDPIGHDDAADLQNIMKTAGPAYYDPVIDSMVIPDMTLEEAVAFCAKAQGDFYSLEEMHREDTYISTTLDINQNCPPKKHSFFFFFWPTLINVPVSFYVAIFVFLIYNLRDSVILIIPTVVLILGIVISIRVRIIVNKAIASGRENTMQKLRKRKKQLKHEIPILKLQLNQKYQWIPKRFRTSYCMGQVVSYIQSGQALDIITAFKMLC